MNKIREIFNEIIQKPLYAGIAGLVIGLIIGLPILGWGLWPVKWTDADPSYLRDDLKKQYVCMVIDSYSVNKDASLAAARLTAMGVEDLTDPQDLFKGLQEGGCDYQNGDPVVMELKSAFLSIGSGGTDTQLPAEPDESFQVPLGQEPNKGEKSGNGTFLLVVLLLLFLLIAGALIYIFFIRNQRYTQSAPAPQDDEEDLEEEYFTPAAADEYYAEEEEEPAATDEVVETPVMETKVAPPISPALSYNEAPVAHFMTSYIIGDDLYDDSFSIDAPNGTFLGECGVGISDTIGVGDPKKVTAFEVWLFDKNDIQTVTKVLMSSYAMNDVAIKQRLASKGEPILLEPGQQILLETATLQLEAKVIEMVYGQGALPSGSFIERLTLELSVWPK